jgi:tetratricopeptide (TPR) repeat protein
MMLRLFALVFCLTLGACNTSYTIVSQPSASEAEAPATTGGSVLDSLDDSKLVRNLYVAEAAYRTDPSDETNIIWLGRRLAYLGRYEDAVDVYTRGLEEHPGSFRLLRHRGHRYITLRDFERAEADLALAAELIRGVPDEVEPDGAPNQHGIPRSTNHSNTYYHLGLARYLQGDYEGALDAYRNGLTFSKNDDMRVATTHWTYMTLRRLGRKDEARAVLEPIHDGMEILENHGYYQALRLYQGEANGSEVMDVAEGTVEFASRGYGAANYLYVNGYGQEARALLERIVGSGGNPAAFGMIAAEVDLERLP